MPWDWKWVSNPPHSADRPRSSRPAIKSQEIDWICLQNPIPIYQRIYGLFFLC